MATVINGKELADKIKEQVKSEVAQITKKGGKINFAAVIVGDNPASQIYVEKKQKACGEAGINMSVVALDGKTSQDKLEQTLKKLSADKTVNGILLQLPLPAGLDSYCAIECIAQLKDVDGLTAANFGCLAQGQRILAPCTALGVLHILKSSGVVLDGADVVMIGRSNIVGKPVAMLLQAENATVTICHKSTKDLASYTQKADIVIVAAGKPGTLNAAMIKYGAVVIDVGINRQPSGIVGDVDFAEVSKKASLITPVPGGVGPLTIAFLLENIVTAYKLQQK